jgi:hypothetical protein
MATTVSRLTSTGVLQVAGTLDEYTIPTNSYAVAFNGTSQYLTATSPNLSGTWTVEMWCYWTTGATQTTIVSFNNGSNSGINLWKNSSNQLVADDGVNGVTAMSTVTPTINAWNHIAFVRSGTTTSGYVNGVLAGTTTYTPGTTSAVSIGRYNGSPFYYFPGYISNLRVVNGTAVYTANFTPPTAPLTAIAGTCLLTCQNATIIDNSTNAYTITNNGAATTSNVPSTFYGGLFNGSQSLSLLTQTAFGYGTGDFTIEFWLRLNAISLATIVSNLSADASAAPHIYLTAGGVITYYTNSAAQINGATLSTGIWYHVALTRASGSTKLFLNGTQSGSTYTDATNYGSSNPIAIGDYFQFYPTLSGTARLNGYISNLRVVKGTAVYTANFAPPTTQLTAITNTSLLALQTASVTKDNSINNFTITNNGSVTANAPITFARSSILSDGTYRVGGSFDEYTMPSTSYSALFTNSTSQYLAISSPPIAATGLFTFECWLYTSVSGIQTIYSQYLAADANRWHITIDLNTTYRLSVGHGTAATAWGNSTIPLNQWNHIVITRDASNNLTFYLNGVFDGSTASYTASIGQNAPRISGFVTGGTAYPFQGYISNMRITSGSAIYTTSFRPPTSPFIAIAGTALLTCQNSTIVDNSTNAYTITNNGSVTTTNTTTPTFARSSLVNDGTLKTFGIVDEFTGNPIADSSLMVWLDPTQGSSYNGTGSSWNDLTTNAKTYTLYATPTYNSLTGGGVITFNGASSQYAQHATTLFNSSTFNTYTMNLWVYPTAAGNIISVCGQSTINTGYHYSGIEITAGGLISFGQWTGGMTTIATSQQTLNQWYNLVITYNGTTATAYVNGTSVGSSAIAWSSPGASTFFALMATDSTNMGTTGYASGSIGSFMAYNRGLTADEVVQNYNATRKRYALPYTYSVSFNGSSQYLSLADNIAFQMGTGAFTVEGWVYLTTVNSTQRRFYSQQNPGATTVFWVGISTTNKFSAELRDAAGTNDVQVYSTTTPVANTWYHVAFVRTGTTTYLFVNGVLETTTTGQSQNISTSSIGVGAYYNPGGIGSPGDFWSGYISNLRVVKGTAVYIANFTPPTAPLTAIAGTSLLTCQSPTIIDTSTNKFTLTNNGTAVVSASVTPF